MHAPEKFNACMRLAEYGANKLSNRQQYEWKVTLAFWAILAGAAGYLKHENMHLPEWARWVLPTASVIGFAFLWLRAVWVAHTNDKEMSWHFLHEAEKVMHDESYVPKPIPKRVQRDECRFWFGFMTDSWQAFQLITTAFLGVIFFLLTE